ncbi:molybdopterin molybdenumtransferase MoeA [Aquicoccus sp. SCR17]|nr:molybdopterin molybdenumtransferase MoeA [Carideicomes alvinocaridis]
MITVDEALTLLFGLVAPLPVEEVPLTEAAGRVLARDAVARRAQPPFPASAMDGYAIPSREARPGDTFVVVGESAAGHRFEGPVGEGQAVRIFTGAPVPEGAERVIIQEDVTREGDRITLGENLSPGPHIRPAGADFGDGERLAAPRRLTARDVALLAAMNVASVPVHRKPDVALIATGDELALPGEDPGPDQIIASNSYGLHAHLRELGALPRLLPVARDTRDSLVSAFDLAAGADLVVTIGGASVGDHDIVGDVAAELGLERAFYKVAMRPGKPLMSGRMGNAAMIGLPGNPVSAMVCGHIFLAPVIRVMQGLPPAPAPSTRLPLSAPLRANGPREHYMRARVTPEGVAAFDSQDSALLSILSEADALIQRPAGDGAREPGEIVDVILL